MLLTLLIGTLATGPLFASKNNQKEKTNQIDLKSAKVEFLAIGKPSFLKIKGESSVVTGFLVPGPKGSSAEFRLKVDSLDTGISLRNEHMNEKYLESKKYPEIVLKVSEWSGLRVGSPATKGEVPFSGELELHGRKNPISGTVQVDKANGAGFEFTARFSVKIKDFAIETPSYKGIKVTDEVTVTVTGSF